MLQLSEGLDPGEVVMVFQGTIPNQKGVPVVQEWVAVRFAGTGLNVVAVEPFEAVAQRLQLGQRLKRLRGRQEQQLELSYVKDQRPQQIKEKRRLAEQKAIDGRFDDHERFVNTVMTIDPATYLKLVAVLHREA